MKIAIRTTAGVVLLIATALAVAGCGGGSKSTTPPPVTVTVAPTTPATTTTSATTTTTTTSAGSGASSLKNCSSLTELSQAYSAALGASAAAGSGGSGTQADVFKAFASKAPAEIRDQIQILADAVATFAEKVKGIDFKAGQAPSAEVIAKFTEASKEFNQPAVVAAQTKIADWQTAHCHG